MMENRMQNTVIHITIESMQDKIHKKDEKEKKIISAHSCFLQSITNDVYGVTNSEAHVSN